MAQFLPPTSGRLLSFPEVFFCVEDETPDDLIVTPGAVNPFDLMEAIAVAVDGAATIAEKIASRGYHTPVAP